MKQSMGPTFLHKAVVRVCSECFPNVFCAYVFFFNGIIQTVAIVQSRLTDCKSLQGPEDIFKQHAVTSPEKLFSVLFCFFSTAKNVSIIIDCKKRKTLPLGLLLLFFPHPLLEMLLRRKTNKQTNKKTVMLCLLLKVYLRERQSYTISFVL